MVDSNDYFYKFRSVDQGLDGYGRYHRDKQIIVERQLWASSPNDFNDPFDCFPSADFSSEDDELMAYAVAQVGHLELDVQECFEQLKKMRDHADDTVAARLMRESLSTVGVVSISEDCTNVLMWSHYADNHRGYCLEFDRNCEAFQKSDQVIYDDNRPSFRVFDLDKSASFQTALLRKAKCWEGEKEWRRFRVGGPGVLEVEPEGLKAIILGAHMNERDEDQLRSLNEQRTNPAAIRKAKLCATSYKIIFGEC